MVYLKGPINRTEAPCDNPSMFIIPWDVRGPTHYWQRVGHEVPGFVVCLLRNWEGKSSEILALHQGLLKSEGKQSLGDGGDL